MVFDITHLKKIRKQLNLTQKTFAQKAGISQSMVAKIESGRLDPTYSYVKKIEETINSLTKHQEAKAKDIMTKRVISVNRSTKVADIVALLTQYQISQVPVIEHHVVVGLVTESSILSVEDVSVKTASDVMVESPPLVAKDAVLSVIKSLLQFYPLILVKDEGKVVGVITKADILKHLVP